MASHSKKELKIPLAQRHLQHGEVVEVPVAIHHIVPRLV